MVGKMWCEVLRPGGQKTEQEGGGVKAAYLKDRSPGLRKPSRGHSDGGLFSVVGVNGAQTRVVFGRKP